jgi:hypothetical protein
MKRLVFAPLLAFSLVLVGCDDELQGLAGKMQKHLGVAIEVHAAKGREKCAATQLQRIASDYAQVSKANRKLIANELHARMKKFIIESDVQSMSVTGELTKLTYYVERFGRYNSIRIYPVTDKLIAQNQSVTGTVPATQLDGKDVMTVTAQFAYDETVRREYYTRHLRLYEPIDSVTSPIFVTARQEGKVWLYEENASPLTLCGRTSGLADVLRQAGVPNADELATPEPRSGD